MSVKKIFVILITIVACVILGAFILNTLMPNVTNTLINSVEDMIYKATSMSFDFNNDGHFGTNNAQYGGTDTDAEGIIDSTQDAVDGFN